MNEWALVHRGHIVNVVTTNKSKDEVQQSHPTYGVVALDNVAQDIRERYEYWSNRP